MVYSTKRLVLSLSLCYFVLVCFSPFSIAITSLGEERAYLNAFRAFVRFALVWFLSVFSSSWCLGRAAARKTLTSGLGLDDMSLAWPVVVQLLVFIYSGIQ